MNIKLTQYFNNFLTLLKIGESGGKATFSGAEIGPAETVTSHAELINSTGAITTPADADKFGFRDSASGLFAHVSWLNIKDTLLAWLTSLFAPLVVAGETRTDLVATNGSTMTLSLALGRNFKTDATALAAGNAFTIALSNVPAGTNLIACSLLLKTGVNIPTVTWPAGVTAPTLTASKAHWYTLASEDNGANWRLFVAGAF